MFNEQIKEIAQRYDNKLFPLAGVINEAKGGSKFQHIRWMCQQIPIMVDAGQIEKANRWLGFIQGTLWTTNMYSIEEMRNHNR